MLLLLSLRKTLLPAVAIFVAVEVVVAVAADLDGAAFLAEVVAVHPVVVVQLTGTRLAQAHLVLLRRPVLKLLSPVSRPACKTRRLRLLPMTRAKISIGQSKLMPGGVLEHQNQR
jgi:hypothetical protein